MAISSINLSPNLIGAQISQFQADIDAQRPSAASQSKGNSVIAHISAFGQFQSTLADLQSKAQSLKNLSNPPTFQDLQVVVQGFVQSVNSLKESASRLAPKQSELSADSRLGQAANNVRKAVDGNDRNTLSALQKVGVSRQTDGMFSINEKQLGESFQNDRSGALSAMFKVADHVAQVAEPVQPVNTGGYAASKAIASYVSVAAL